MNDVRDNRVPVPLGHTMPCGIIRQNVAEHLAVGAVGVIVYEVAEPFKSHLRAPISAAVRIGHEELAGLRILYDALAGEDFAREYAHNPEDARHKRLFGQVAGSKERVAQRENRGQLVVERRAYFYGCGHTTILASPLITNPRYISSPTTGWPAATAGRLSENLA